MIQEKTQKLINKIVKDFDKIKQKTFPFLGNGEYFSEIEDTIIGKIGWNNPNLIWILVTTKEEAYEGSQSQVGIDKEGNLRWQYQSHCSCDGYEDTRNLPEQFTKNTLKSFDFYSTCPPLDWEIKMQENMKKIIKA